MPELGLTVGADVAASLTREAERLGFDSREAYVRWLLDRRETLVGADANANADADDTPAAGGSAPDESSTPAAEADGGVTVSLSPGRVRRPDEGEVSQAADRLGDVERERFGAMLRASTADATDGRPGSDLADLDALDLPGRDETLLERRRRLVGAGLAYLREAGEARRADFLAALREEYPAGYDSDAGWWECLSRGLRQVHRVRDADADVRTWRYRDVRGRVHVRPSRDWE